MARPANAVAARHHAEAVPAAVAESALIAFTIADRFDAIENNRESLSAPDRLHAFFDTDWDWRMAQSPEFATSLGHARARPGWTDMSLDAIALREAQTQVRLRVLASINRGDLSPVEQVSYDLFKRLAVGLKCLDQPVTRINPITPG